MQKGHCRTESGRDPSDKFLCKTVTAEQEVAGTLQINLCAKRVTAEQKYQRGGNLADKCKCKKVTVERKFGTKILIKKWCGPLDKRKCKKVTAEQKVWNKNLQSKKIKRWWDLADKCKCKKVIVEQKCRTKSVEQNCQSPSGVIPARFRSSARSCRFCKAIKYIFIQIFPTPFLCEDYWLRIAPVK